MKFIVPLLITLLLVTAVFFCLLTLPISVVLHMLFAVGCVLAPITGIVMFIILIGDWKE